MLTSVNDSHFVPDEKLPGDALWGDLACSVARRRVHERLPLGSRPDYEPRVDERCLEAHSGERQGTCC